MPSINYIARDTYTYVMTWLLVDFFTSAGGTFNPSHKELKIEPESDFAVQKMCYQYQFDDTSQSAANRLIGGFNIQIFDSTSGRYWFDQEIEIDTTAGTGELPFVLPVPKVMVGNSSIAVDLRATTNIPNGTNNFFKFELDFIGDKLFRG